MYNIKRGRPMGWEVFYRRHFEGSFGAFLLKNIVGKNGNRLSLKI